MGKPDWFMLIERWVPEGMGRHGVTLPFLVGALAYKAGLTSLDSSHVRNLLDEITGNPVEGYVTEVSWCGEIAAPVFNTKPTDSLKRMSTKVAVRHSSGTGESLVFGPNLVFHWNCKDAQALVERLIEDAASPVSEGKYSRKRRPGTTDFEYGDFLPKEISYIERTIMRSQQPPRAHG